MSVEIGRKDELRAKERKRDEQNEQNYGRSCPGLPTDIINFQHDPLACAIAAGWHDGVEFESVALKFVEENGWLYERPAEHGTPTSLHPRRTTKKPFKEQ